MRIVGSGWYRTARSVVAVLAVLLATTTIAAAETIAPGQEEVLAAMLGRGEPLPGECAFTDGNVDREIVHATYRCAYGTVRLALHPRATTITSVLTTERFAVAVTDGSPHDDLLAALAARIRDREGELETSTRSVGTRSRTAEPFPAVRWISALALVALAAGCAIGGRRTRPPRPRLAARTALESLAVAALVVLWLQIDAAPPAHQDTAVDVALGRDCLASGGALCLGHTASAIGLVQGQAFTYALAGWLALGWSMRALSFLAACGLGAATGLLHYAIARPFGATARLSSAIAAGLAVAMTGYPIVWNPSWFVLPLTIAFVATLALARGGGLANAVGAGLAFAFTAESHLLFGTFVAIAVVIVSVTARDAVSAAAVVLATFVLTELVVSPTSLAQNARILLAWIGTHPIPVVGLSALFCAAVPSLRRLRRGLRDDLPRREAAAVVAWMLAGAVGLGLVLPWMVGRPLQARYFGGAFPALAYTIAGLLGAPRSRARAATTSLVAVAIALGLVTARATSPALGSGGWLMDDGAAVARTAELAERTSALAIQLAIRPMPGGRLAPAVAAFAGTTDGPAASPRILRAVLAPPGSETPPGWYRLRAGRADILTSELDAWARPEEARVCPDPPNGECVTLTAEDFRDVARSAGGLAHRLFGFRIDRAAARIGAWSADGALALLWTMPLRPTGSDTTREILIDDALAEPIVAVEGTHWKARTPRHALVERPSPGTQAAITVRTPITDKFEAGIPPLPFEFGENERSFLSGGPRAGTGPRPVD